MKIAVVQNNLIKNVFVGENPDYIHTFPAPNGKWIGDLYDDGRTDTTLEDRVAALEADAAQAALDRAALTLLLTGEETV